MAFKDILPKFSLFMIMCAIGLITCNPIPSNAGGSGNGSSNTSNNNSGSSNISSGRIDWSNPCDYPARNRTSRDIKKQHELLAQVNIAYNDYAATTAQDITELYGNVTKTIQCNHKFLFGKSKGTKSNSNNSNNNNINKKRLVNFYKELQVFGQRVEKVMDMDIDSADGVFEYTKRLEILSKMRDGAKRILCEMYDVLPDKNRRLKLRSSRQMDNNSNSNNNAIPDTANMTNTIAIDVCTFDSYKRMISSLGKFLNRKQDKSKFQQRRKHAAVRRSKDQKPQPKNSIKNKNNNINNKRRRKQQQQKQH
ncbi:PREDICTED: probable basic-leucine zipper transcription factor F [Nicrophorus vespilloides]|uniref:Probable basic-leucine zipper transcription factor F n=1 Tax=Nicrophorus vespilloides TaxID=110193 RepID=A0ABM1M0M1_NICVS|nr:PREDICTED: probable basic-leucine zipper transcription factor F [Nicrophorus vespilloides]